MAALGDVGWRPGLSRLYAKGLPYSDKWGRDPAAFLPRMDCSRLNCFGILASGMEVRRWFAISPPP
jgi:hypothetical protein